MEVLLATVIIVVRIQAARLAMTQVQVVASVLVIVEAAASDVKV